MKIRQLEASEIEVRVQSVNEQKKFALLLLYKDARCDMRILDETFGITGWQRYHEVINGNLFCTVEVYDEVKNIWVKKQDVGTESNADKEKGEASDSFKRASTTVGVGRELYTAPPIFVNIKNGENIKFSKFKVKEIKYNARREIVKLVIVDANGEIRFSFPKTPNEYELNLDLAFQEAEEAKTLEDLEKVWGRWKAYQSNKEFIEKTKNLKSQLLKNAQNENGK